MNHLKCVHCGLVNFETHSVCRRCNEPLSSGVPQSIESEQTPVAPDDTGPQIPATNRKRSLRAIVILALPILLVVCTIYGYNYVRLQSEVNKVVSLDSRNDGIGVSVHYAYYVDFSTLVYDLRSVSGGKSMTDVFRVFLQFSEKMQSQRFTEVELMYKGKVKFTIAGDYFQTLGNEYSFQNPVYTMRSFPENLKNPDGTRAYAEWSGGILGVALKQMEDFNDFHKRWYLDDFSK
jgi:hypothetical protein